MKRGIERFYSKYAEIMIWEDSLFTNFNLEEITEYQ